MRFLTKQAKVQEQLKTNLSNDIKDETLPLSV